MFLRFSSHTARLLSRMIAPIPSSTLGTCLASSRSSALIALLNSSALRSMRNDFSLVYSVFVWFLTRADISSGVH